MEVLLTIGEIARRGEVSAQTLRHYDRLGLLPPAAVTAAGYRLYSARELHRLELIRTLREVGFGLDTIGGLLHDNLDVREAVALQLEVLGTQMRPLERRRVLLRAVLAGADDALLSRLRRLGVLGGLSRHEREAFLARKLSYDARAPSGSQKVWQAAIFDLPETLTEAQLESWLELAELAADGSFQDVLRRQREPFAGVGEVRLGVWSVQVRELMIRAAEAVQRGERPDGDAAQRLIADWLEALAAALDRTPDADFAVWALGYFETTNDPRFARYWELVADLKGWQRANGAADVTPWLVRGLNVSVRGTSGLETPRHRPMRKPRQEKGSLPSGAPATAQRRPTHLRCLCPRHRMLRPALCTVVRANLPELA